MFNSSNFTKYMRRGSAIVKGTIEIGRFAVPYRIYENEGPILYVLMEYSIYAMWLRFSSFIAPHL